MDRFALDRLGVAIITFATLLGVNAIDGLSTALRFVLAAVALGTSFVGYLTGSMTERERSSPLELDEDHDDII